MTFERDWKESYVDKMGLIVALSGSSRFDALRSFKIEMAKLPASKIVELKECLRQRFTPTNGMDGCQSGTESVRQATA